MISLFASLRLHNYKLYKIFNVNIFDSKYNTYIFYI